MAGPKILSATYGDDISNTDVTDALANRISDSGKVSVPVNSSVVPFFTLAETVSLNDEEIKQAKEKAVQACGGAQDQICVAKRTEEMKSNLLDEKRARSNRVDNIVRGNRLELVVQDGVNQRKIAVPEGQVLTEEMLRGQPPKGKSGPIDVAKAKEPPFSFLGLIGSTGVTLGKIAGVFVAALAYVLAIFITWKIFRDNGYVIPRYIATATTVVIPGSGFVITPLFFGLKAFADRVKPALETKSL